MQSNCTKVENREQRSQDLFINGINFEEYQRPPGDNEEIVIQANQFYKSTAQNYREYGRGNFTDVKHNKETIEVDLDSKVTLLETDVVLDFKAEAVLEIMEN